MSDGGVARPGDVLIVHVAMEVTMEQAAHMRAAIMSNVPGLADVLLISCLGTTIYRAVPE